MKRTTVVIFGLFLALGLHSQSYYPFPTDTAQWDCVLETNWDPDIHYYYNYHYLLQGDIVIDSILYKKVYLYNVDGGYTAYLGGLREDTNKNIYFYPNIAILPNYAGAEFPNNTEEHLLYTFDSLVPGMTLPINPDNFITVMGIDSVLIGNSYRKRYEINQSGLFGYDYWIEGIGSIKDLFAPYSEEHEFYLYTLCFTDSITYFINSPGAETCYYPPPVNVINQKSENILIYPIPAETEMYIEFCNGKKYNFVYIYDLSGHIILKNKITTNPYLININNLTSGIYYIELINENEKLYKKFLKK